MSVHACDNNSPEVPSTILIKCQDVPWQPPDMPCESWSVLHKIDKSCAVAAGVLTGVPEPDDELLGVLE